MRTAGVLCGCVLLAALSALAGGQCNGDSCSEECYPDQWERELCLYYLELEDWRSLALHCGLVVPSLRPSPSSSLSPTEQWEQVREEWNAIRDIWEARAQENGVFNDGISELSGSGSGQEEEEEEGIPLEEVWQEELEEWQRHHDNGKDYVRREGLPIPLSQNPSTSTDSSEVWLEVLSDWTNSFVIYNETYYDLCPSAL